MLKVFNVVVSDTVNGGIFEIPNKYRGSIAATSTDTFNP